MEINFSVIAVNIYLPFQHQLKNYKCFALRIQIIKSIYNLLFAVVKIRLYVYHFYENIGQDTENCYVWWNQHWRVSQSKKIHKK